MNKQSNRAELKLATILIWGALAHGVYADAYRNPAPTSEGIAKSGANMVFVDDASAISYNPANLAFQTNASVVVAVAFARAENTYSHPLAGDIVSDDPWVMLPNLYVSMPISDGLVAGLGITTPYGQGIDWGSTALIPPPFVPVTAPILYKAEIALININPTIAMKIGDSFSVGIGADIYYSELTFNAQIPVTPPPPPQTLVDANAKGTDWGIGGNIGLTWQMTENQRAAFSYRSQINMDYEGDFSLGGDFATTVKYPNTLGVGYGIQITDTVQVEALLEWSEWSVNDVQTVTAGPLPLPPQENNWDNTITAAIGGSWQFADSWTIRSGYSFIESPIPDATITPLLPDTDRHIIGLGLGYTVAGHTIDLSYSHTIYADRTSTNPAYPGTYDIDSNLVGVTYSFSF